MLIPLSNETFQNKTANKSEEARLDISANGFWIKGQKAFFDVRVFNLFASRYNNQNLNKCFKNNEEEKKRSYNERVLQVQNGSFTPLVFSINGGMGRECKCFYQRLAGLLSEKRHVDHNIVINWLRTNIAFSLLRSMLLCIRGSRTLRKKEINLMDNDIVLTNAMSEMRDL